MKTLNVVTCLVAVLLSLTAFADLPQGEVVIRTRDGRTRVGRVLSETSRGFLVAGRGGTSVIAFADIVDLSPATPEPLPPQPAYAPQPTPAVQPQVVVVPQNPQYTPQQPNAYVPPPLAQQPSAFVPPPPQQPNAYAAPPVAQQQPNGYLPPAPQQPSAYVPPPPEQPQYAQPRYAAPVQPEPAPVASRPSPRAPTVSAEAEPELEWLERRKGFHLAFGGGIAGYATDSGRGIAVTEVILPLDWSFGRASFRLTPTVRFMYAGYSGNFMLAAESAVIFHLGEAFSIGLGAELGFNAGGSFVGVYLGPSVTPLLFTFGDMGQHQLALRVSVPVLLVGASSSYGGVGFGIPMATLGYAYLF